ncbi:MAG TPA: DUF2075 domain-containing protein, partial [Chromatiaceae bacterium]|nr:DUF2075 domain-containing protein [Chromatiaceae bacterium]
TRQHGECDFVVAHPAQGILFIEVKGGEIRVDGDRWESTDRHGITYEGQDPVRQAKKSKYALLDKLRARGFDRRITLQVGVIFPDAPVPEGLGDIRPNMPRAIFADRYQMESLGSWVRERLGDDDDGDTGGDVNTDLGVDGIQHLEDMFAKPIHFRPSLQPYLGDDMMKIETVTREQFHILQGLDSNHRVAIPGAAGTGKTYLAMEKTLRLAEAGKRVLLICFNSPLSVRLGQAMREHENIHACSFHSFWVNAEQRVAREENREARDFMTLCDEEVTRVLLENIGKPEFPGFDAVIVDEGQDFHGEWLEALELTLKGGPDDSMYVFYDDNQAVLERDMHYIKTKLQCFEFRLTTNLRNTRKIFSQVNQYYLSHLGGPVSHAPGSPEGCPIEWLSCENHRALLVRIRERIETLVRKDGISRDKIVVLFETNEEIDAVLPKRRLQGQPVRTADSLGGNGFVVDTIRRFKGLESQVVLLILTKPDVAHQRALLYTGMSRAQARLEVLGPAAVLDKIRSSQH